MTFSRLRAFCCFVVLASAEVIAQEPAGSPDQPGLVAVRATAPNELRAWESAIDRMVRSRELVTVNRLPDPDIDGRAHETLLQYHLGVPVFGGGLSRQTAQGVAVSIFGTVYEDISIDTTPSLSAGQVALALAGVSGGRVVGDGPALVVFPTPGGGYRLAYRATMSDMKTYIVDAATAAVLWTMDEIQTQSQVGSGTGALGDSKKVSATQVGSSYRAHDLRRPAPIRTFDTRGSDVALNRLLAPPGLAVDTDFSVDADNIWVDPPVVDTHAHTGWMEDYLFKQVNWTGIDNRGGTITSAVHSGLVSNAFFIAPPFGADGRGMFVYGRTPSGITLTTLDVVGHEMMHGVTNAALTQRTGTGLLGVVFIDRFGPTAITSGGSTMTCDTAQFVFPDGTRRPLFCNAGRFVLLSNHGGAINEAFSDVFGIAAEFFHHPVGIGPLQADYKLGEDMIGFGPNRAADVPASLLAIPTSVGFLAYPDHASRMFTYLAAVVGGTPTLPVITLVPWTIVGNQLVTMPTTDGGGVHLNATILSHAFYLAVEGGRNATSGLTVQGVGGANRAQIERAFFRAMTVLMPNAPSLPTVALVTIQAAVDLHGPNSPAVVAIRQAMQAVGLAP
jgi:Zn-dependent metalloprotease